MDQWRTTILDRYVSTHYEHLNKLDESAYQSESSNLGLIWDRWLPNDRNSHCLDLGCGGGKFLYYLRTRGFERLEGVDASPESATIAANASGAEVHCEDAAEFLSRTVSEGRRYGLIAAHDLLEHLAKPDLFSMVSLIRQALTDDGVFLVKTLNAASLIGGYGRYMDLTHEVAFTEESLRQLFGATGFSRYVILQPKPVAIRSRIRWELKQAAYWAFYRIVEGRKRPACIDFDIFLVAKG